MSKLHWSATGNSLYTRFYNVWVNIKENEHKELSNKKWQIVFIEFGDSEAETTIVYEDTLERAFDFVESHNHFYFNEIDREIRELYESQNSDYSV